MLIVFLGKPMNNQLANALKQWPAGFVLAVKADGDPLTVPKGITLIEVSQIQPKKGARYQVVAHGASPMQVAPLLIRLSQGAASIRILDGCHGSLWELWSLPKDEEKIYPEPSLN